MIFRLRRSKITRALDYKELKYEHIDYMTQTPKKIVSDY